mmetsp:Transcript_19497/g.28900  ORF Transcript_19497/g.28900 Transcript_19497/m.28900 type:complete len:1296 (-) Transcript_19497:52-3939(-)
MSVEETFDIGARLSQRLESTRIQKETTQAKINELNNELEALSEKNPKHPRESMTETEEKINSLESKRTTSSMPLQEEKAILKEIHFLQRVKAQLEEYNLYERKVQEKKGQLTDLKEALKTTITAIEELESALFKVSLAAKLGCSATELKKFTIEVDNEKIGRVIGKSGSTIKQLEQRLLVHIDVDSESGQINLTGSEHNLARAMADINKITMAIDDEVKMPKDVINYFTTKHVHALALFREQHTEVQVEAYREKGTITIRGLPEAISRAKSDLSEIHLSSETRILVGREWSIVVGKSGSTINRLVEKHQVIIDVSETQHGVFTATIVGPPDNINVACNAIDELLESHKEVTHQIKVDPIVRNALLADSGARIKKLQKECSIRDSGCGIQLNFQKEGDGSVLVIKGRRAAVEIAKGIITERIEKIQSTVVTINVDPFIVPKIIGRGGETIKKLQNGKSVNIDVDRTCGRIVIHSHEDEEVKKVETQITEIINENQIERIQLLPKTAKNIFRELIQSDVRDDINSLVWMGLDDETSSIIIRGARDNLNKAKIMVQTYVSENYIQEVEISAEDEPTLLAGGCASPIQKFQDESGAELNVIRSRFVVLAKGSKENVQAAVTKLKQFLHGGDGYAVSRISATEQALGIVIGKSGSKRAELEKKHDGVNLFIHRSNRITIRGPHPAAEACRIDILRLLSSVRVNQVLNITPDEHRILSDQDSLRRAIHGIPVQVNLTERAVKIRGFYSDVRDAECLLKDLISGVYEAQVELEATQVSCVRESCRDPSHFQKMEEQSNSIVSLDLANNAIMIRGKRGNVQNAKKLVLDFLEVLLPSGFAKLTIPKPLETKAGDVAVLAECAAMSGATVNFDRDLSAILIQSSSPEKVKSAKIIIQKKVEEAEKLAFVVGFEVSESWLIPLIIGKNGNRVKSLRVESGCSIDINKPDRTVSVIGSDEASVIKAREMLENIIDCARRQCAFMKLPDDSIAAFVGRGGSHIRAFANENRIEIERMRKDPTMFKIFGEEAYVITAKQALQLWIDRWLLKKAGETIVIDELAVLTLLGKQGSAITALRREYDCEVEINREELTLAVRGSNDDNRRKAMKKIRHIIDEDEERVQVQGRVRNIDPSETHDKNYYRNKFGKTADEIGQQKTRQIPKSNDSLSTFDSRKDRTSEFAGRPVGLTIVEKDASKPKNKKRNRNKTKLKDFSDEQTLQVGSSAGRSLFNLLISESSPYPDFNENHDPPVSNNAGGVSLVVNDEQWDSSTVSSAAIDSSDQDDEIGKNASGAKPYIKSASGFTVRV